MGFVPCSCEMAVFKLGIFLMVIIGDATLESANGDNKVRF